MALEVKDATVRFGGVTALNAVAARIQPGRITALVGPNGSGKSTLLNAVTGIVKLSAGEIRVDDVNLAGVSAASKVGLGISRTFQTPRIDPATTVETAVLSGFFSAMRPSFLAALLDFSGGQEAERTARSSTHQLLQTLGLDAHHATTLSDLPMGFIRLVDVARAMASGPKYLLLDEPAAGLSLTEQNTLGAQIRKLAQSGVGILLVEHNFRLVRQLAEHVIVLSRGAVLIEGTADEVARDGEVLKAYLGAHGDTQSATPATRRPERPPQAATIAPEPVAPERPRVLACAALSAGYGPVVVINGIDLKLENDEVLALVGANGAGKSTLLGAIAGVVRHRGAVRLLEQDVSGLPAHRRASAGVAFVPEIRGNIFSSLSVTENIALGVQLRRPHDRDAAADELLELFPILRERHRAPAGMLSGGEQQMLAIAIAMGRNPRVVLLDEPTQGLAPAVLDLLARTIERLRARQISVLLAEQNVDFAAMVSDRYLALSNGGISARGPAAELRDRKHVASLFF